ncbi:bifunctional adenosylcobinamide kinase/adenosylcobinamide-phosphate guanylyltransferase [uncultured Paludibaculum sp.]|uniref:bifunctional adenosylcobinamide kinase/adenosylcobinamide-phosphate guanylyltransferase n=1 Tax=uncultured Paludibaculum sp. TaxID=1765020 RepID=UPI002AAAD69A|nr:bifunctional adenosylcobinamide kinase/adenosylcobinamide-phosphate guanylyltransferase [uncultured Paludibaculum sp.]
MALAVVGGGRRSGKSRYALALASAHGPKLGFIATLRPDDEESAQKVERARDERGAEFMTVEEPLAIAELIEARASVFDSVVIDDLTLWVSNLVMAGRTDEEVEQEANRLIELARNCKSEIVVVTSDVDFGFPMDPEPSRQFRRLAGLVNRLAAEAASRLYWMVFGVPKRIR